MARANEVPAPQTGGTRGSSNQGGPDRAGEPEKDQALKVNSRKDRGSRATIGRNDGEMAGTADPGAGQPRGPLPEGASTEDYVGGKKPHKTRTRGTTRGASGKRNEVV
ncbi:MAG TPA: hypothetical protein VGQ78_00830 [Vicinamibacteria bacterium]|jgi:hypothetical protein|nr:hypothetical protein [Vicinamibacteria bacterium]